MPTIPPCQRMGRHCRVLDVTVRVTAVEGDEDHDATWLLGHTERINFGALSEDQGELWSEANIYVPCRYLGKTADGKLDSCKAHGYQARVAPVYHVPAERRLARDRFPIVEKKKLVTRTIPMPPPAKRTLPIAQVGNPCATAPCRTSDLKQGSACCRDIQVDIVCGKDDVLKESLIRSRQAPYLCKTERENDDQVIVEIISACGYLNEEGACDLHGRSRADGRPAKPLMCFKWPEKRTGLHAGCAFKSRKLKL
jgi:hypothetical protein